MKYQQHIQKINTFIDWLKDNQPIETTHSFISKTFFNNNNSLERLVVKVLKDRGYLMTNKSWCKGKGQKWSLTNIESLDLNSLFENHGHLNDGHLNHGHLNDGHLNHGHLKDGHLNHGHLKDGHLKDGHLNHGHLKEATFKYKGFGDPVTIRYSKEDIETAKNTLIMLGDLFSESKFIEALTLSGFDKYKAFFFYQKAHSHLAKKQPINKPDI